MKQAWILYNGFLSFKPPAVAETFRRAGEKLGVNIRAVASGSFLLGSEKIKRPDVDFCVCLDKDLVLCRRLEEQGVPLFNSCRTIAVCDDKAWQILELGEQYFPETYFAPKCYHRGKHWDRLPDIGRRLGYPLVVKECFGSWGEQVYLAEDDSSLLQIYEEHSDKPLLFQKFIRESAGQDGRAVVVGGRVIGAIRRTAKPGEFRANVERGASVAPLRLDEKTDRMCREVAARLGAAFCAVDLLFAKDRTYVCEVNASPGFAGFDRAAGVCAEEEILRDLLQKQSG